MIASSFADIEKPGIGANQVQYSIRNQPIVQQKISFLYDFDSF